MQATVCSEYSILMLERVGGDAHSLHHIASAHNQALTKNSYPSGE
jgi:hypothetical protein